MPLYACWTVDGVGREEIRAFTRLFCIYDEAAGCIGKWWVRWSILAKYNRILINACWRLFNVRHMRQRMVYVCVCACM